jgi:hypothetical protein
MWLVGHAGSIAAIAIVGLVVTMMMTRPWLRRPSIVPAATGAAVIFGASAFAWWWLVGPAAIAATVALVGRRLRIERARIQAEDPAAGSEVFTLRGMIAEIRGTLHTARAFVRWHRRGFTIAAVALPVLCIGWRALYGHKYVDPAPPAELAVQQAAAPQVAKPHPDYQIMPAPCAHAGVHGCAQVDAHFRGPAAIDVAAFPGMSTIPQGWRAQLALYYTNGSARGVTAVAFPKSDSKWDQNPQWLDGYHPTASVATSACGGASSAMLRLTPDQSGPSEQDVTLIIEPTMALALDCP